MGLSQSTNSSFPNWPVPDATMLPSRRPDRFHVALYRIGPRLRAGDKLLRLTTEGDSMWPLLATGATVTVVPLTTRPSPGDIVVYPARTGTGSILVAHRVIALICVEGRPAVITRGDNRSMADPPVPIAHLLGRIVVIQQAGRRLVLTGPGWRGLGRLLAGGTHLWPRLWRGRMLRARQRLLHTLLRLFYGTKRPLSI
ncbi:MAG: S24/S26 family peptidase [Caldilineaceae bacterium]|nr:S24/S26 family peptidase [Caldilineaceae bacterium]